MLSITAIFGLFWRSSRAETCDNATCHALLGVVGRLVGGTGRTSTYSLRRGGVLWRQLLEQGESGGRQVERKEESSGGGKLLQKCTDALFPLEIWLIWPPQRDRDTDRKFQITTLMLIHEDTFRSSSSSLRARSIQCSS